MRHLLKDDREEGFRKFIRFDTMPANHNIDKPGRRPGSLRYAPHNNWLANSISRVAQKYDTVAIVSVPLYNQC
jgi:hypothetical protein